MSQLDVTDEQTRKILRLIRTCMYINVSGLAAIRYHGGKYLQTNLSNWVAKEAGNEANWIGITSFTPTYSRRGGKTYNVSNRRKECVG